MKTNRTGFGVYLTASNLWIACASLAEVAAFSLLLGATGVPHERHYPTECQ